MNLRRPLALAVALAASLAFAAPKKEDPDRVCADRAADAQEKCQVKCFKVDPNKKDQVPDDQQKACLAGCPKRTAKVVEACKQEQAKADAEAHKKDTKDHANEYD